jgi:threonine aldolase
MTIDLRSDTVTHPTPPMLEAMMSAKVGDDVFNEDPTIIELEHKAAELLGKEAGLFCPSGTMCNQIAIRILTVPQDEIICDKRSHIYNYEGGGMASNSGISVRLLDGDRGRFTAEQVLENINPDDIHFPRTTVVSLENTVNKGGGSYYDRAQIESIYELCQSRGLKLHLDGARLFNALTESKDSPQSVGKYFDTISICLSKGLGAPVGSVLLGSKTLIAHAKRVRKAFGGGMRQAGYLAAAGIYALDNNIDRLSEDHRRARAIEEVLNQASFVESVQKVDTNIIIFTLKEGLTVDETIRSMEVRGVKTVPFGPKDIRMVTHLDFDDKQLTELSVILSEIEL